MAVLCKMTKNELPLSKDEILDAAEQVLRRYGPDKTSVVDIAKVLQVSHGTLYRHFESKAALREAVTSRWLHTSIAVPLEAIASETGGSAVERLRLWLDTLIQTKRKFAAEDAEMFAMYANVTVIEVEMISTHMYRLIKQLEQIIEQGMASKELKPGDSESHARAIFLATSRFHHPSHAGEWGMGSMEEDFESVWQLLLGGLK
jgi:AcrR family transcriptional regulator